MNYEAQIKQLLQEHATSTGRRSTAVLDSDFDILADKIVKLFPIQPVIKSVCDHNGLDKKMQEIVQCRHCEKKWFVN